MLKTFLEGHDKYYGISDILRMFYGVISEDRGNTCVNAEDGPDMTLVNTLGKDGRSVTVVKESGKKYLFDGPALEPGREVKRSLYIALTDITGQKMPWGCLSGIRPTLVASEEGSAGELIDTIVENTDPDDRISVYGKDDWIYVLSERMHATRYSYQYGAS